MAQKMLIAFDGSTRARLALERAAELLKPSSVEILTAWEPVTRQTARALGRTGMPQTTVEQEHLGSEYDEAEDYAMSMLREGVELAQQLGLEARAHLVESSSTAPQAIVDAAKELQVDVIVLGTRGIGGVRSWFTNSTAESVVHNAGIPVFIVPPVDEDDTLSAS
ncbi:universal stress protein [Corynebacterium tapiri]